MRPIPRLATALLLLATAAPAFAQVAAEPDPQPVQPALPGRTADTATGQIGQRQTREQAAEGLGVEPMGRIANRVQNRVQNRLRTRIDRNYDPRANATSPFEVAEGQQRRTGQNPRR